MRLRTMVFVEVLMCLFISICTGGPTKEVGAGSSRFNKYTEEEDRLIIAELSSLLDVPYTFNIWSKITEKHNENWKAGTRGFPQERTLSSICSHFWKVLMNNLPTSKVKVPETLRDKLQKADSNQAQRGLFLPKEHSYEKGKGHVYSQQEEDLIVEVLRKPSCTSMLSLSTLETIRKAHERKRRAGTNGFANKRTISNLRPHLTRMRHKGKIPSDVWEKFSSQQKGPRYSYTTEENKLLVEELLKRPASSLFSTSTMESIRAQHDTKRMAKVPGFEKARSVGSLSSRVAYLRNSGQLPDEITEKWSKRQRGLSSALGTSRGTPSNSQQTESQMAEIMEDLNEEEIAEVMEELHEEETDEMIEELLNNTEFQVDFSKYQRLVDKQ